MAVLSVQLVITLVFASIFSKLVPRVSVARWLLGSSGLVCYLAPEDRELKSLAGYSSSSSASNGRGSRRRKKDQQKHDVFSGDLEAFTIPRNLDVQLEKASVNVGDLEQLRFYEEYQWLVDFSAYALLVYASTEVYMSVFPDRASSEINLSMVWSLLVAGSAYKMLAAVTGLYFKSGSEGSSGSGERSLVIVMAFLYLLAAMVALVVDEEYLEAGLDEAYDSFNKSASVFLADNAGLDSSGPASKLVLKFFLALWCASIGALFTFPGIRLSRMQWDALQYAEGSGAKNVFLHLSFVSPLLLSVFWIRPLAREYLTERRFKGMTEPFMTNEQFETLRLYLLIGVILLRMSLMPTLLQSYLNKAYHKMEAMKQEAGRISNIDLQKSVTFIFYYLCVVTLQFIAPMILILFLTLMYKTMGGGSWSGVRFDNAVDDGLGKSARHTSNLNEAVVGENFSLAWQSLKQVFTPAVFRGLLGFSTWWCCFVWFTSAGFGFLYQSYFATA